MAQSESWKPDSLFRNRGQTYLIIFKMSTCQFCLRNSKCSSCLYHPKLFVTKVQILDDILSKKDDPYLLACTTKTLPLFRKEAEFFTFQIAKHKGSQCKMSQSNSQSCHYEFRCILHVKCPNIIIS